MSETEVIAIVSSLTAILSAMLGNILQAIIGNVRESRKENKQARIDAKKYLNDKLEERHEIIKLLLVSVIHLTDPDITPLADKSSITRKAVELQLHLDLKIPVERAFNDKLNKVALVSTGRMSSENFLQLHGQFADLGKAVLDNVRKTIDAVNGCPSPSVLTLSPSGTMKT